MEGSGGGGIATWALITGNETVDGIGASANATLVHVPNYDLRAFGGGIGLFDRAEVSYEHQSFDTDGTGAKLGLGRDFTFDQDVLGAKVRLLGDAVYDQDHWTPQVLGLGFIQAQRSGRDHPRHWGQGRQRRGLLSGGHQGAAQLQPCAGRHGAGHPSQPDRHSRFRRRPQQRLPGGIRRLGGRSGDPTPARGRGEHRTKPDNLGFARESNWSDLFAAYAVTKSLSVTAAYADLGDIATFRRQRGWYLSLQAGF